MGNSSSTGQGHWTESHNVLRDAERIRTQPMPRPAQPTPNPVTVDATPTHVAANTGSAEMPLGRGFAARVDGPNGELGARPTPSGGFRAGAQANAGGVSLVHRNPHHEFALGGSLGVGPGGVELHDGPMPGVSISAGPVTATARHTALAQPVSPETERAMMFMGRR